MKALGQAVAPVPRPRVNVVGYFGIVLLIGAGVLIVRGRKR
jgi:hypothetical protein